MRRFISLFMAIFLFLCVFTGCAGFANDSKTASVEPISILEPTKITWHTAGMSEQQLAAFETYILTPLRTNLPAVEIEHIPLASGDWAKTLTALLNSGEALDLFTVPNSLDDAATYGSRGLLYDMSDYAEQYGWNERLFPWARDACSVDGRLYLLPLSYDGIVLWYNRTVLDQSGLEVPADMDELTAAAQKAQSLDMVPFGFEDEAVTYELLFSSLVVNYCGGKQTRSMLDGTLSWKNDGFKAAIEAITGMVRAGWMTEMFEKNYGSGLALFLSQKSLVHLGGIGTFGQLPSSDFAGFSYDVGLFPSLNSDAEPMLPVSLDTALGVGAKSEHAEAIAAVINFLYTDMQTIASATENGVIQAPPFVFDESKFSENMDPLRSELYGLLKDAQANEDNGYCSWSFWPVSVRQYIFSRIEDVFDGSLSIDDFADGVQKAYENS